MGRAGTSSLLKCLLNGKQILQQFNAIFVDVVEEVPNDSEQSKYSCVAVAV